MNTERVERLRKKALEVKPFLCGERAKCFTEAYKENEDKDPVIRKALAVKKLLDTMTLYINEEELIVGNNSSGPRGSTVSPEYCTNWLMRELLDPKKAPDKRAQDKHIVTEDVKEMLTEEVFPYWLGKTVEDRVMNELPEAVIEHGITSAGNIGTTPVASELFIRNGIGHVVVDYKKVLKKGFIGILHEAKTSLETLELSIPGTIQKRNFYQAVIIYYKTIINWIKRYSALAEKMSKENKDERRRDGLKRIAQNCRFISENPPLTFRQALQTLFFAQLILFGIEQNSSAVSLGRLDQHMYSFYERDIKEKILSRDKAIELLQCFFVKLSEMSILYDYDSASYWSGFSMAQCLLVGGVDENGNDATNELSYLIIEADKNTGLLQPELAVRVHPNSPQNLLFEALKEVKIGRGKPKFYMDNSAIAMIQNTGVSLQEARDYSVVGCVELTPTGNTAGYTGAVLINLAKCLELALNDGQCLIEDEYIGVRTGTPDTIESYEVLVNNFKKQIQYAVKNTIIIMNAVLEAHAKLYPCAFTSSLIKGCMERGIDFTRGGSEHNFVGVTGVGLPNVANALIALREVVFTQKKHSLAEFVSILRSNFEENEELRLYLWNKIPKFGNDIDSVDVIARTIGQFYCEEIYKYKGVFDFRYRPGLFAVSINVPFGLVTGATADGRKAGRPLADGGISPAAGTERNSILGVIKSATKIDNILAGNGTLLNARLSPSVLEKDEDILKLLSLLKTYNELGGYHIQFNVVDNETLMKAKKNPENYRGLMVRVAGYCAYFVELNPEVQDDIISRTIHGHLQTG